MRLKGIWRQAVIVCGRVYVYVLIKHNENKNKNLSVTQILHISITPKCIYKKIKQYMANIYNNTYRIQYVKYTPSTIHNTCKILQAKNRLFLKSKQDTRSLHGVRSVDAFYWVTFSSFLPSWKVDSVLQLIFISKVNFLQVFIKLEVSRTFYKFSEFFLYCMTARPVLRSFMFTQ